MGRRNFNNVTDSKKQEAVMVRYLLGQSPEEERTQVEERYFSDGAYFDRLLALEDSLIDDFVSGRMPAEQLVAFKESLSSRQDEIRFSRALFHVVTKKNLDQPAPESERRLLAPPHQLLPRARSFQLAVSIAALVLIGLGLGLFLRTQTLQTRLSETEAHLGTLRKEKDAVEQELNQARSQRDSSERELDVERNRRIDAEASAQEQRRPEATNISDSRTIVLGAVLGTRGATGRTIEARISENVLWLRFVVPVKGYGGYDSYSISIKLAGQPELLERGSLKPTRVSRELALTVAATNLRPGDYILTLFGERPGAAPIELERYPFRIIG